MPDLLIFALVAFAWALVSRRLESSVLTAPMWFVGMGLLLGPSALDLLEFLPSNQVVLVLAEVALVVVLFTDAARMDLRTLRGNASLPSRLLAIGLLLTIGLGTALAALLFTDLSLAEAAMVGTVLAPTDAALGEAVVANPRVPARIRQALNVEAGLNDGLAVPFLTVFLAVALAEEQVEPGRFLAETAAKEIGFGVLMGLAVGIVGGWLLDRAIRRGWVTGVFEQLAILALAITAWIAADEIEGSGFIAAYVGGLATAWAVRDCGEKVIDFTEDMGQLLNLSVFFVFGVLAGPLVETMTWQVALYAALSLTVIRIVPVGVAMIGAGLERSTVLFLGWFGPRGLATIILTLLVLEEEEALPGSELITLVAWTTVLFSVFSHGVTAAPLAERYGRRAQEMAEEAPEMKEVPEVPTRRAIAARRPL